MKLLRIAWLLIALFFLHISATAIAASPPPILWKNPGSVCMTGTPALGDDGRFYAPAKPCVGGAVGITAFSSIDGSAAWGPMIPAGCADFGTSGASVGANGLVYAVGDWNSCADGRLVAFNTSNGIIAWDHGGCPGPAGDITSPHPRQVPAINEALQSIYFGSTGLCSVTMNSGVNNWVQYGGGYLGAGGMAIDSQQNVYYGTSGFGLTTNVIRSYTSTGAFRWELTVGTRGSSIMGVMPGDILLIDYTSDTGAQYLLALDSNKNTKWQVANVTRPVLDSAGNVYVSSVAGADVASLNPDGSQRWGVTLPNETVARVDFVDNQGHVYVRGSKKLYALNTSDGSVFWPFIADADLSVGAVLAPSGHIFFSDINGNKYLLDTCLSYANSAWPSAEFGNRRHTEKVSDKFSLPSECLPSTNLSAEIPAVTQAPPTSDFPAPQNMLTDTVAFITSKQSQLSPGMRSYIQAEILRLQSSGRNEGGVLFEPLSPTTKTLINASANTLQFSIGGAQAISDLVHAQAAKSAMDAAFYLSGMTKTISGFLPYTGQDKQTLTMTKRTSSLIRLGYETAVAPNITKFLISANLMIWGDYLPSIAHDFAKDPPALEYREPVPVILPDLPDIVGTQHDAFFNQWNRATLQSVAFLEAVNASFDRYTAALQAGDNLSAATQLAAYLHYLRLFTEALTDAKESYIQLTTVLTQLGVVGGSGNESTMQDMQSTLAANGLPPDFVDFLLSNGLSSTDLPAYQKSLTSFTFQPGPDIYASTSMASRLLTALFSRKVHINIKPDSASNLIRLKSSGMIPVAILSDAMFDATQVDPASVILSGAHAQLRLTKDKYACRKEDSDGDGLLDFVCHIPTGQLAIQPSDTIALLTATTFNGQAIAGVDFIKVIP